MTELQVEVLISFMHRIAVALERHTEVMLEHSGLLQESIAVNREHLALHADGLAVSRDKVEMPSDRESIRIRVLTPAEEQAYFAVAARWPALHDLGRLMVLQGVRPDEAMRARVGDVVGDQWTIQSGKSAAAKRVLTLTVEAAGILAARSLAAGASGWLFRGKRAGTRLTKLNGVHDKALKLLRPLHGADFGFVLYDLRHTFATRMAAAGVPITTLAKILGHSSLRIVMRYVHPTEGDVRAAMRMFEAAAVVKTTGTKGKVM